MFLFNCRSHHTAACERTAKVRESRIGRREKLDFFGAVAKIALILNEISNIEPGISNVEVSANGPSISMPGRHGLKPVSSVLPPPQPEGWGWQKSAN
jgi:hypothetical protein